jgi:hypothetical protein
VAIIDLLAEIALINYPPAWSYAEITKTLNSSILYKEQITIANTKQLNHHTFELRSNRPLPRKYTT